MVGMEVIRERLKRTITITNRKMITEPLSRFNMSDCKRSPTPLAPKDKIMSLSEDPTLERAIVSDYIRFMQAAVSIQFIAMVTQPDLAFAAHGLAPYMAGSAKNHWLAVQHVMTYLQCKIETGLSSGNEDVVDVFHDANFVITRRQGPYAWRSGMGVQVA